ncbi:hypothetical protein MKO06_16515 [Gramella sp. GC03-9]|uniref:Outer membrane protein beta-barrel domain-containing protein n=1 Tax=Christiangramia oceanisediminis TaxID=2920386 RepID=A0A9X2L018_9FLAO|nr:hypothetical protein [Gramella oceanisediminis]MCP9201515.1 hypothetical protein [Gramella oceanisediminis]
MRLAIFMALLFCSFFSHAQFQPRLYAGGKMFYNKAYESNLYGAFEAGAEVFRFKFLAPEIGINYYAGTPNEFEKLDFESSPPQGVARYDGRFHSFNFSIAPKLIFGNKEAALVILPEYNFGTMRVYERFFQRNGNRYELREDISESSRHQFWTFSAGVEGDFFSLEHINFSLLLTYNTLNSEKAFEDLQFSETNDNYSEASSDGLGITFRAYFDIFKN